MFSELKIHPRFEVVSDVEINKTTILTQSQKVSDILNPKVN